MSTKNSLPAIALLLDGCRGVYIPQKFCQNFDLSKWQNIDSEDVEIILTENGEGEIQSPYDIELYWDAWQAILDNATFTENGYTWRLSQDGDLWAYCYELMTNEERRNFGMDEIDDESED